MHIWDFEGWWKEHTAASLRADSGSAPMGPLHGIAEDTVPVEGAAGMSLPVTRTMRVTTPAAALPVDRRAWTVSLSIRTSGGECSGLVPVTVLEQRGTSTGPLRVRCRRGTVLVEVTQRNGRTITLPLPFTINERAEYTRVAVAVTPGETRGGSVTASADFGSSTASATLWGDLAEIAPTSPLVIGGGYDGVLDSVRVWHRALGEKEMAAIPM